MIPSIDEDHVIVPGFLAPHWADGVLDAIGDRPGKVHRRHGSLLPKHRAFGYALDSLLDYHPLMDWLGNDFRLSSLSLNVTSPGADRIFWHVDYPHFDLDAPWPEVVLGVQCIVPLTRSGRINGGTALMVHRDGEYVEVQPDLAPGDLLMYDTRVEHTAMPNRSAGDRALLLATFVRAFVEPFEDMRAQLRDADALGVPMSSTMRYVMGEGRRVPTNIGSITSDSP